MAYITGKSGNYTFQDTNKEFTWRVNWSEEYDIALNSSIVSIDSIEILSTAYNDIWWLNALVKINEETVAEMNYYNPPTHYVDFKNRNTYYPVIKYGSGKAFPFVSSAIPHNADGTKSITIAITANPAGHDIATIQLAKDGAGIFKNFGSTKSATIELTNIPRAATLTSAPNFSDEDNPTITYSNPAGAAVDKLEACISLTSARADIAYREVSITGNSYTFNLTEAEREVLRQATLEGSTSRTVYFILQTTIAGATYRSPLAKTFTVINAEPQLSALVMDVNETTAALTGDRLTRMIKGYSNAAYELNATALKGASITGYIASNGSESFTTDSGTFAATQSANFTFSATDNRGQTVSTSRNLILIDYFKPTCNAEATLELDGETTARANIKISGTFFNASFGAVKNSLEILIKHSAADRWISLTNELYFEPTTSGNTYTIDFGVSNLDYSKPFTYQCKVVDKLDSALSAEDTKSIYPVFDWSNSDFNFNVPVSIEGSPLVDFIIEQGTEPMGSNGVWYWSKWKSGKAECYGCRNYGNMAITMDWESKGTGYISVTEFKQSLPSGLFIAPPLVINRQVVDSDGISWIATGANSRTKDYTDGFYLVRSVPTTIHSVYIGFHVIGRWK